jgi:membrane protein
MKLRTFWDLIRETIDSWNRDKGPLMGAALAFYTALSLAPLFLIAIVVVGLVFGRQAAQGELLAQLNGLLGMEAARIVERLIKNAWQLRLGTFSTAAGIIVLFWVSTRVFWSLKNALNVIWRIPARPRRRFLWALLDHLFAFAMVIGTCLLLLVSLIVNTTIAAVGKYMTNFFPDITTFFQLINFGNIIISFLLTVVLFALIFRFLPDGRIAWRDIWIGAAVTAFLFNVGKIALGYYLGRTSISSIYGAAGSFVLFLLWVYYSSQTVLFGAEFTRVFAKLVGYEVVPKWEYNSQKKARANTFE